MAPSHASTAREGVGKRWRQKEDVYSGVGGCAGGLLSGGNTTSRRPSWWSGAEGKTGHRDVRVVTCSCGVNGGKDAGQEELGTGSREPDTKPDCCVDWIVPGASERLLWR